MSVRAVSRPDSSDDRRHECRRRSSRSLMRLHREGSLLGVLRRRLSHSEKEKETAPCPGEPVGKRVTGWVEFWGKGERWAQRALQHVAHWQPGGRRFARADRGAMATGPRRCRSGGGEIPAVGCGKKRQLACPRREMRGFVGAACRRPKRTVDFTSWSYRRLKNIPPCDARTRYGACRGARRAWGQVHVS